MVPPQLPPELWLYIAQFIPEEDLRHKLLGVNKFFYEISMDLRYRQIELDTPDSTTTKLISRLSDPHVGRRVRSLIVSPDFRFFGQRKQQVSLRSRVSSAIHNTFHPPRPKLDKNATRRLINILSGLMNTTAFTIDSHSWGSHSSSDLPIFLQTAWSSFGNNLRELSLRGHAFSFRRIIQSNSTFPSLEELSLELIDDPTSSTNRAGEAEVLVTDLEPFITSLSSQLKVLDIWSLATSDLSHFFLNLGQFPLLTSFKLETSFTKTFRADPSGLTKFLQNHCSQLECLVLRLNTAPLGLQTGRVSEELLGRWMKECFSSLTFTRLRDLEMYPTVQRGGMEALILCIQQSQNTLKRLIIRDRYLDHEEIEMTMLSLSPDIRSLRFNVKTLNVELVDLASRLSELRSLSFGVGNLSPTFLEAMESRSYANWKLEDLEIWRGGSRMELPVMRSLMRSTPSLINFWGTPYVKYGLGNSDDWIH